MTSLRTTTIAILLVLAASALTCLGFARPGAPSPSIYIRVNQVGYLSGEPKVALALSNESLDGAEVLVEAATGDFTFDATVGQDRGSYGAFSHVYEIDLSSLDRPGVYRIAIGAARSPEFPVGGASYRDLIATSLEFFRVQRCGDTGPAVHGVCHLTDGTASGGPRNGQRIDVSGGWHDAGDYLKFMITQGASTLFMLTAYDSNPAAFADGAGTPPLLDEATVGIEWIARMWNPKRRVLYYQVGDASDHDEWRLPEGNDSANPARPVFACPSTAGANVAGKAAAVLALASVIWNDPSKPYRDAARAARYVKLARQIYAWGKNRPSAVPATDGFYEETSWEDDMALAATELYRATGKKKYLRDAREYARDAGAAYTLDWGQLHALAHYELGRIDEDYRPHAVSLLARDLEAARENAAADRFRTVVGTYRWGSAATMTGMALEAFWYEALSGDDAYRDLARAQRDYVLGANPWGVCFVNGAGSVWPRYPHHQIANLDGVELTGFWDEGPVRATVFEHQQITLTREDAYAAFQSDDAVYHDDVADYVTNEPTLDAAALGIALTSWYAVAGQTGQ